MADVIVPVELGARRYDVVIGRELSGIAERVEAIAPRCVVVTDRRVAACWGQALMDHLGGPPMIVVDDGEENKNAATWSTIVHGLIEAGVDRQTAVVALGGGVLGDLAGFAAASTLRGLPLIQVPTTSLAMVDSSVGGKTGFNHPRGKNLIGAFHQPSLVWIATETLSTLDPRHRRAGLGEVLKTALLDGEELFARVEATAPALANGDEGALSGVVAACVAFKADVVARDEREAGLRAILNAGHTVAHAYETAAGYGTLLHGEAVALGLVAEARWARRRGLLTDPGLPERLLAVVERLGLPTRWPEAEHDALVTAITVDKKVRGGMLRLPVPCRVGAITWCDLSVGEAHELVDDVP